MSTRTIANPAELLTPIICIAIDARLERAQKRFADSPHQWEVVARVVNYDGDDMSHLEVSANGWAIDDAGDPITDFGPAQVLPLWSAQVPAQPAGPVAYPAA